MEKPGTCPTALLPERLKLKHDTRVCEMGDDTKAGLWHQFIRHNLGSSNIWLSWRDCVRFSGLFFLVPQFFYLRGLYWGPDFQGLCQSNIAVPEQTRGRFFGRGLWTISALYIYKLPSDACYVNYVAL